MSSIRCETRKRKIVSSVEGCVATRRNNETNLLVGANLSLDLFPSFAYWHTVARVLSYSSFALSFSFVHAHVSQLLRSLLQTHWNQPFFSSNTRPQCPRISTDHPVFMLSRSNTLRILFCVTNIKLFVTFLDASLYDNAIYEKEKKKGIV